MGTAVLTTNFEVSNYTNNIYTINVNQLPIGAYKLIVSNDKASYSATFLKR